MAKTVKGKSALIVRTKERALARNKARLAELMAVIRRRMTEVVEGFYDLGEALREILDRKLYAAEGHASLDALLKAEGLMTFRQASKLVAVVRKVPREQALTLGQEKAYALVAYTEATTEDDSPAGLISASAKVGARPAVEASVREIKAATREARARAKAGRPMTPAERERHAADEALAKALKGLLRDAGVGRAEVVVGRSEVRVTLARSVAERATRER